MRSFINRVNELTMISEAFADADALLVLYGRRRIGKTRLLRHWGVGHNLSYTQAIEGAQSLQIRQIYEDLRHLVATALVPRTWPELLSFLAMIPAKTMLVIDEFPYLIATNPSVPSLFQRWLELQRPEHLTLTLMGSSQRMMQSAFLDYNAPLYQRAARIIRLKPLSFAHFLESDAATGLAPREAFLRYSLVGGIPAHWERLAKIRGDVVAAAEALYLSENGSLKD